MESEDYEIMPHKELVGLKDELRKLRTRRGAKTSKVEMGSFDSLNGSIQELLTLFKEASKEMKSDENEEAKILQKLTDAIEMMGTIVDQNEKIAEGIVTVAEMIKDHLPGSGERGPPPDRGTVLGIPVMGVEHNPPPQSNPSNYNPRPQQTPQQYPPPQSNPSAYNPRPQQASPFQPPVTPNMGPSSEFSQMPGMGAPQSAFPQMGAPPADPPGMPGGPIFQPENNPMPNPFGSKPDAMMDSMPPPPAPPPPPSQQAPQQRPGLLSRFK